MNRGSDCFSELFEFSLPARVNFVGGGGKTSLILKFLEEYSDEVPAVYTTTTRIHPPHPSNGLVVISSDNEEYLNLLLARAVGGWSRGRKYVVSRLPSSPRLLRGVTPTFAEHLDQDLFPVILNEADGARSMSLKMPREGEPVFMTGANYLVPVIGLDCINRPMGPETLFRWEIASRSLSLRQGQILKPELASSILFHPQGVCKFWKPGTRIIPYINKADSESDDLLARSLALALVQNGHFPVERVVWGSTQNVRAVSLIP